jgi:hypothetical protein
MKHIILDNWVFSKIVHLQESRINNEFIWTFNLIPAQIVDRILRHLE